MRHFWGCFQHCALSLSLSSWRQQQESPWILLVARRVAAVASSSLPGVFEPNKLLVKDADGTERSESATQASFIDGSMEQDLPMQQLSEMFNVNHFIISQANPHAVMFASYSHLKSVWSTPLTGLVNSILIFFLVSIKFLAMRDITLYSVVHVFCSKNRIKSKQWQC